MSPSFLKLSLAAALVGVILVAGAHAQDDDTAPAENQPGQWQDPLDRYQRDPLPQTRLGDDNEVKNGPTEPKFQGIPDYDDDPLPPVINQPGEDDDDEQDGSGQVGGGQLIGGGQQVNGGQPAGGAQHASAGRADAHKKGAVRKPSEVGSQPPPGAFAPEPNAFGPPRGAFRLPTSIGAPGVAPAPGTSSTSAATRAVVGGTSAPSDGSASANAPDGESPPSAVGDDDNAPDPFESSEDPAPEEWDGDRRDARSHELAVPDDYLDPSWPDDDEDNHVSPEQSDNVENVPMGDDQEMDQAEKEETERYKEALGLNEHDDEFKQDDWGDTPADRTRERDNKEYEDPAEW